MIAQSAAFLGTAALGFGLRQRAANALAQAMAPLAQALLARAWRRTLNGARKARPWPWAETWPIARLTAAGLRRWVYVLADSSSHCDAYGPIHVTGTAPPGAMGNSVISGHRSTPFHFLQVLASDGVVLLETTDGNSRAFRITNKRLLDTRRIPLAQPSDAPELTLVMPYPFDSAALGPLCYVVTAVTDTP